MPTVSLYRKYRSQTFGDLIGQDHVVRTLRNALTSGRIAHSYLFTGPRGTGKTSTARLLAKALCCEQGPTAEPDNTCEICRSITLGNCVDVYEMDAASESGVDDIRTQIVEAVDYQPMVARYKVFIIDEVHDLSSKAFDALLKTVEEPPPHIVFILATTEYNRVPPTIRSRCQKFEFHRASVQNLVGRLEHVLEAEGATAEPAAIAAIARMADGGFRDALTLLEQAMLTSEDGRITLEQVYDQLGLVSEEAVDAILVAMREGDVPTLLTGLAEVARLGRDPRTLLESMLHRLADLTRAAYAVGSPADGAREASLHAVTNSLGRDAILRFRGGLAEAHKTIRDISLPRLWLESELVRLALAGTAPMEPARVIPERTAEKPSERRAPEPRAGVAPIVLSPADEAWRLARETISAQSPTMAKRLEDAVFLGVEDGVATLELERQMDVDWILEGKKRAPAIATEMQRRLADVREVRYVVRRREGGTDEPAAVELPAEGQRLEQLAREVFGVGKDASGSPRPEEAGT